LPSLFAKSKPHQTERVGDFIFCNTLIKIRCLGGLIMSLYSSSNLFAEEFDNRWPAKKTYDTPAITEAMDAVREGIPCTENDPMRPIYHFRPPARWMNDPCGAISHKGYYHVFYQLNPTGDFWGVDNTHWGHTRSKDLVYWEHLPIALWPSRELGERRCNSGCVVINDNGQPMIFYTYVPLKSVPRQQWVAIGDDDLITWKKHPDNPIVGREKSGIPSSVGPGWSDPFVFRAEGRTFVTFKSSGGTVCEAQNRDLTRWKYIGSLDGVHGECPNFFKLDDKWVLLTSGGASSSQLHYQIGSFDPQKLKFTVAKSGILDHSYGTDWANSMARGFYATNILFDSEGRCILFGWVSGFKNEKGQFYGRAGEAEGRGWNGCLGLPRVLTLRDDVRPRQTPVPELQKLRDKHIQADSLKLNDSSHIFDNVGDTWEILAEFEPYNAKAFGLKVRHSADGKSSVTIRYESEVLNVAGTKVPLKLKREQETLTLHVFLDKSVMEVFINGGRECVTRVIYPGLNDLGIELFSEGGMTTVKSLDIWTIKPIWEVAT